VRLRFGLTRGRLDVAELAGKGLGGSLLARGIVQALDDPAKGASLDVHAEGRDLALAPLLALAGAPRDVTGGTTRFTFDGKASGASLHDWASSLDGTVVLLNRGDGTIAWKCLLDKKGEINRFHGETENGFLISSGDERFWLVGHDGSVLMRCVDQCLMQ
jgi:hypothetical protein